MLVNDEKNKTTFDTGAVRAVGNGKGRFDLMPLEIYSAYLEASFNIDETKSVLHYLAQFQKTGNANALFAAIEKFRIEADCSREDIGLQVAIQYEEGEKKYPSSIVDGKVCLNAYKGLPLNCFLDSACRHYLKWRKHMEDEPHDRAIIWNIMMAIWTVFYREDCCNIMHEAFVGHSINTSSEKKEEE